MKSIGTLAVVLIIGFAIGSFTGFGNSFFSFLGGSKTVVDPLAQVKETISDITKSAQKETGAIFDKKYLDTMITMYEGSVALSKIGTVAGGRPELRSAAKTVSKDDAIMLEQLKKWRAEWYPEDTKDSSPTAKPPFIKE